MNLQKYVVCITLLSLVSACQVTEVPVTVVNGTGIPSTVEPTDPTLLQIKSVKATEVQLSWVNPATDSNGLRLAYSSVNEPEDCSDSSTATQIAIANDGKTEKTVSGLVADTSYFFRLCSFVTGDKDTGFQTRYSPGALIVTKTLQNPANEVSNLRISKKSSTSIHLDWTAGTGASSFRLSYAPGAAAPANCDVSPNLNVFSANADITGLSEGTAYSVRVCSLNSNPVPEVSAGSTATYFLNFAAPAEIANLSTSSVSTDGFTLNWSGGGGTTTGYAVALSPGSAPASCDASPRFDLTNPSLTVNSLTPATTYFVRVCAKNANPIPDLSAGLVISITTAALMPGEIASISASISSRTHVYLAWPAATGGTQQFLVRWTTVDGAVPADCVTALASSEHSATVSLPTSAFDLDLGSNLAGGSYGFRVCAQNAVGVITGGVSVLVHLPDLYPAAPTNIAATELTPNSLKLSWSAGDKFNRQYQVSYCQMQSLFGFPNCIGRVTLVTSATASRISDLIPTATYQFSVTAFNANVPAEMSATTTASLVSMPSAPSAPNPAQVRLVTADSSSFQVAWSSGGDGTTGYKIAIVNPFISSANCDVSGAISLPLSTTNYTFGGLTANSNYTVKICAKNANPIAIYSAGASFAAHTLQLAPPPVGSISASSGVNSILVSWVGGGGSTAGYRIASKAGVSAPTSCDGGSDSQQNSFTLANLPTAAVYSFVVCALNADNPAGVSAGSVVTGHANVAPPANITGLKTVLINSTSIGLSWIGANDATTAYRVAYAAGTTAPTSCGAQWAGSAATTLTVSGLNAQADYAFRVCAINNNNPVDVASGVTLNAKTLQPAPPVPVLGTASVSASGFSIGWTSGGGSTSAYKASVCQDSNEQICNWYTGISVPSLVVAGLTSNTTYYLKVYALNSNPEPDLSRAAALTLITTFPIPPDPSDVVITAVGNRIDLRWRNAPGATGNSIAAVGIASADASLVKKKCAEGFSIGTTSEYSFSRLPFNTLMGVRVCSFSNGGISDGAFVSVRTGAPTQPVATAVNATTSEDQCLSLKLTGVDPEGDALVATPSQPAHGTLVINGANQWTDYKYCPAKDYSGSDSFTFTVTDMTTTSAVTTANIKITPVNDAPVGVSRELATYVGQKLAASLQVSDVEGDSMTFVVAEQPARGTVKIKDSSKAQFEYQPADGFIGAEDFKVTATDSFGAATTFTQSVKVVALDGGAIPVVSFARSENQSYLANFSAFNNELYAWRAVGSGPNGSTTMELWKSDGTESGTQMIKSFGSLKRLDVNLAPLGNALMIAVDGTLWKLQAGSTDVIKVAAMPTPQKFLTADNVVYAVAYGDIWRTDGTADGTFQLTTTFYDSANPILAETLHGSLYWLTPQNFWKSDGTAASNQKLGNYTYGRGITKVGDSLYFTSSGSIIKSDGTIDGTTSVNTSMPNSTEFTSAFGVYLAGFPGSGSAQSVVTRSYLYTSDGTENGTSLFQSAIGEGARFLNPWDSGVVFSKYYPGTNGVTIGIYKMNSLKAGDYTGIYGAQISNDKCDLGRLLPAGKYLYFNPTTTTCASTFMVYDGTKTAQVQDYLAKPINTPMNFGTPGAQFVLGNMLYFLVGDSSGNWVLMKTSVSH